MSYVTRYVPPSNRPKQFGDVFDIAGGVLKGISSIFGGGGSDKAAPQARHWSYVLSTGVPYEGMTDNNGVTTWYWAGRSFTTAEAMKAAMAAAGATAANPLGNTGASVPAGPAGTTSSLASKVEGALPWIVGAGVVLFLAPKVIRSLRRR